jgi:NAD(P)-dependent dehydrogenase (short-subunit alcohol dehydrogenase family)
MIEKERCGSIVNVSSIAGINPVHSIGTYSCTKAALDMMTKSMALEFGPYKVCVISLGLI